jgi:Fructose-bisphosphate aldolase class-II
MSMGDIITSAGWSSFIRSSHIVVVDLESVNNNHEILHRRRSPSFYQCRLRLCAGQPTFGIVSLGRDRNRHGKEGTSRQRHSLHQFVSLLASTIPRLCSHDYSLCCTNRSCCRSVPFLPFCIAFRYDIHQAFAKLPATVKAGVVTGQGLKDLLNHAKATGFAIPGVNIVGTNSINSCMEAAMKYGGPIMVTFSKGGGQFIAGKALKNENDDASIAGCIAGAKHVREVAKLYNVPVVLHTDHCQKAWLPWFDGLMAANEEYYKTHGEPLFSSHMLDLSEEPLEENIAICKKYLERMAKFDCLLEFELGVTGGEEDGVGTLVG